MYRQINFSKISNTLSKLQSRISERFPQSGLANVCDELDSIAKETEANLILIAKPNFWLRTSIGLVIAISLFLIVYSVSIIEIKSVKISLFDIVQVAEAAINDIILFGLALFFLISLETKLKRTKILNSLNQLRAITHIIDMHQLTKDPTEIGQKQQKTLSSPKRNMTPHNLKRYLDYCSEMLSIVGKIAAVYAQKFPDTQVLSSVNEVESLTSGISRKIWQKIMIIER